ncbi:hypothetical protein [Bradyrhizobium jicamae]|uniref:hypothetical protein n=1 Tax=Bradyrhizobium jicamae TaxID=280332 RepID=UPI001BABB590|nr:hypothetical protein [Bradyrhizobium jicamae]MBR0935116.1 hypothetical protein [Bradyrhizobium jicamae]
MDFSASAGLFKWPSFANERREDRGPYLLVEGTLDECIRAFMAKPEKTRHLYEIRTPPRGSVETSILSPEHIVELARLRDFL